MKQPDHNIYVLKKKLFIYYVYVAVLMPKLENYKIYGNDRHENTEVPFIVDYQVSINEH